MARPKISRDQLRSSTIGVRVSSSEYDQLRVKASRYGMTPAQWLRHAALTRSLPAIVPAINTDAYQELGRIGKNINQITRELYATGRLDAGLHQSLFQLESAIKKIRLAIIGDKS